MDNSNLGAWVEKENGQANPTQYVVYRGNKRVRASQSDTKNARIPLAPRGSLKNQVSANTTVEVVLKSTNVSSNCELNQHNLLGTTNANSRSTRSEIKKRLRSGGYDRVLENSQCQILGEHVDNCIIEKSCDREDPCGVPFATIGDRFRVRFGEVDAMGRKTMQWYFGTAVSITRRSAASKSLTLDIKFEDNEIISYKWPSRDVQKLLPAAGGVVRCVDCADVAYSVTTSLRVGDLVECLYQNGKCSGARWRGRVAEVSESKAGCALCDVAYTDGEFERKVAIQGENLRLVMRGAEDTTWLIGLQIQERTTSRKIRYGTVLKRTRLKLSSEGQTIQFKVRFDSGESETRTYENVTQLHFSLLKAKAIASNNVKIWPVKSSASDASSTPRLGKITSIDSHKNDATSTYKRGCNSSKENVSGVASTSCQEKISYTSKRVVAARLCKDTQVPTDAASMTKRVSGVIIPTLANVTVASRVELHPSLSNAVWQSLNSAEPQYGACMLTEAACVHGIAPNANLAKKALDTIVDGPKSDSHRYADANKLEFFVRYGKLVTNMFQTSSYQNEAMHMCFSWHKYMHCMTSASAANPTSSTRGSYRRFELLQQASCATECLSSLLRVGVNEAKDRGKRFEVREFLISQPTHSLFSCAGGTRQALKCTIQHSIRCWVQNGMLVNSAQTSNVGQSCALAATRCLTALGSLVSSMSWIFCMDEEIRLDSMKCAFVFKDVISTEVNTVVDTDVRRMLLISFISTLKYSPELQLSVAKVLHVLQEYSVVHVG